MACGSRPGLRRPPRRALDWSLAALAVLIIFSLRSALASRTARAVAGVGQRWRPAGRPQSSLARMVRRTGARLAPATSLARRIRLTFASTFALVNATVLAGFCWQTLARPMPLVFTGDSFGYTMPGILWAAGRDTFGQSSRDVGYPALTALALRLGSLREIPLMQLLTVVAGVACLLCVLYGMLVSAASRLNAVSGTPIWILALGASAIAVIYCMLLASDDSFVLDIYSVMAEAPHLLPTALALLLLVAGWAASTPALRVTCSVLAVTAAYLSTMVKPHTSIVLALCIASSLVVGLRQFRALRSLLLLAACAGSVVTIMGVHRLDAWVTPARDTFGPKMLFCNHLDVVQPVFDARTPERARIRTLIRGVLENPVRWDLLGFYGDLCLFSPAFDAAVGAVAKSEGLSPASWERREFLKAIWRNPIAYASKVLKQYTFYMTHPVQEVDRLAVGGIPDDNWAAFQPFLDLIRMSHNQFDSQVSNWVPSAYPVLAGFGKALLGEVNASFAAVTLGSTALALGIVVGVRRKLDLRAEMDDAGCGGFHGGVCGDTRTGAYFRRPSLSHRHSALHPPLVVDGDRLSDPRPRPVEELGRPACPSPRSRGDAWAVDTG